MDAQDAIRAHGIEATVQWTDDGFALLRIDAALLDDDYFLIAVPPKEDVERNSNTGPDPLTKG